MHSKSWVLYVHFFWIFTIGFCRPACLSSTENGSGGSLQGKKLQPAQWSFLAVHLITCHPLLVHFPLHLLKKIRHLHLLVVPQSVTLQRDTKRILKVPYFEFFLLTMFSNTNMPMM